MNWGGARGGRLPWQTLQKPAARPRPARTPLSELTNLCSIPALLRFLLAAATAILALRGRVVLYWIGALCSKAVLFSSLLEIGVTDDPKR